MIDGNKLQTDKLICSRGNPSSAAVYTKTAFLSQSWNCLFGWLHVYCYVKFFFVLIHCVNMPGRGLKDSGGGWMGGLSNLHYAQGEGLTLFIKQTLTSDLCATDEMRDLGHQFTFVPKGKWSEVNLTCHKILRDQRETSVRHSASSRACKACFASGFVCYWYYDITFKKIMWRRKKN